MSEKNQIPFRFSNDTAGLINKGLELYKRESQTQLFSKNQLIEFCIKKTVLTFPNEIKDLNKTISKLKAEFIEKEKQLNMATQELDNIKKLLKTKIQIGLDLNKLL